MRILVLGDSITQGYSDTEGGWVQRIRNEYTQIAVDTSKDQPELFNLGVSGDGIDDVLDRLEAETKAQMSTDVGFVFAIGLNDTYWQSGADVCNPEQFGERAQSLIAIATNYSKKLLFIGMTPCDESRTRPVSWIDIHYTNDRIRLFNRTLSKICQDNRLLFVDVYTAFSKELKHHELLSDGLHPNHRGHQLIASLVKPHIDALDFAYA